MTYTHSVMLLWNVEINMQFNYRKREKCIPSVKYGHMLHCHAAQCVGLKHVKCTVDCTTMRYVIIDPKQ